MWCLKLALRDDKSWEKSLKVDVLSSKNSLESHKKRDISILLTANKRWTMKTTICIALHCIICHFLAEHLRLFYYENLTNASQNVFEKKKLEIGK
jgi:hypothetical protein